MVSIIRSGFISSESVIELGSESGRNSALELMVSGKAYLIYDDEEDEEADEQEKQEEHSRELFYFHSTAEQIPHVQRKKKSPPEFKVTMGA